MYRNAAIVDTAPLLINPCRLLGKSRPNLGSLGMAGINGLISAALCCSREPTMRLTHMLAMHQSWTTHTWWYPGRHGHWSIQQDYCLFDLRYIIRFWQCRTFRLSSANRQSTARAEPQRMAFHPSRPCNRGCDASRVRRSTAIPRVMEPSMQVLQGNLAAPPLENKVLSRVTSVISHATFDLGGLRPVLGLRF